MTPTIAWILLVAAGLFEVGWAFGLKHTDGLTRLWPTLWTAVALVASMALLAFSLRALPLGTAYAVWVGIGAVGTAALGMLVMGDQVSAAKIAALGFIVVGVVGLNLAGGGH